MDVCIDFASGLAKAGGEVIEINRGVRQRLRSEKPLLKSQPPRRCAGPIRRTALWLQGWGRPPVGWPNLEFQFRRCAKTAAIRPSKHRFRETERDRASTL